MDTSIKSWFSLFTNINDQLTMFDTFVHEKKSIQS